MESCKNVFGGYRKTYTLPVACGSISLFLRQLSYHLTSFQIMEETYTECRHRKQNAIASTATNSHE